MIAMNELSFEDMKYVSYNTIQTWVNLEWNTAYN